MKREKPHRRDRRTHARPGRRLTRAVLERVADRVAVAVLGAAGRLARRLGPA